jgi:hypothetical protein
LTEIFIILVLLLFGLFQNNNPPIMTNNDFKYNEEMHARGAKNKESLAQK